MTSQELELIDAFEVHRVADIRAVLDRGIDASRTIDGKSTITHLLEGYYRSDTLPECMQLLIDRGAKIDDPYALPVVLNDAEGLLAAIRNNPGLLSYRVNMQSTFTSLHGATLLHVAAEYGNLDVAKVLIEMGADVNARADTDANGLNGHTPLFHTVNSNANRSAALMSLLLDAGARCDILLPGIVWGEGYEWETIVFEYPQRIPYLDVLVHLDSADAVFILGSTEPHYTPSKVYQGILAGKPILAVLHAKSSAAAIIEEAVAGKVLTFNGAEDITSIYQNFATAWQQFTHYLATFNPENVNQIAFNKYSAWNVVGTLSSMTT